MIILTENNEGFYELEQGCLETLQNPNDVIERLKQSKKTKFFSRENKRGVNSKFWLENTAIPEGLMFKYHEFTGKTDNEPMRANLYGELIVDLICNHTDMKHTNYYPCEVHTKDQRVLLGSASTNYRQGKYNKEFSAETIDKKYKTMQYDNNNGNIDHVECNTVYGYITQLQYLYHDRLDETKLNELKTDLLKLALLDFATLQIDRHWGNIGWMINESEGIKSLITIPAYDNECSFGLDEEMGRIEALALNINTAQYAFKKIIMPKAVSKKNTPLLGIKTSTCINDKGPRLVPKSAKPGVPNPYDVFIDELSDEIITNPELRSFYNNLNGLDLNQEMQKNGYFPNAIIDVASSLYNARMGMLNEAVSKKTRSHQDENTLNE